MVTGIRTDINQLLAQMQTLTQQAQGKTITALTMPTSQAGFSSAFTNAMAHVNQTQVQAEQLAAAFEQGDQKVNLADTMVAAAKAKVEFQAAVQMRNRFVNAYQEIMNMPL